MKQIQLEDLLLRQQSVDFPDSISYANNPILQSQEHQDKQN
jgi:hypothetical protein